MEKTDMYTYICEEADQCRQNVVKAAALTKDAVALFRKGTYQRIVIAVSGSSYNGSVAAVPFMEEVMGIPCEVYSSYTFANYGKRYDRSAFVFGAGQSGRSTNTNDALDRARAMGLPTVGLTAEVESEMKNHCDVISDWGVGIEKNGCVTKGYTTLVLYYMLFAVEAAKATGRISEDEAGKWMKQLGDACGVIENMVKAGTKWFERNREELSHLKRVQVLGCGAGYGSAIEGALKIAETACIPANAYEQEEFLHGPCFEDGPDYSVFVIDSRGPSSDRAVQLYNALHFVTERTYLVTNRETDDPKAVSVAHDLPAVVTPLVNVIPFQIVASHARETRQMNEGIRRMSTAVSTKTPKTGKERGF